MFLRSLVFIYVPKLLAITRKKNKCLRKNPHQNQAWIYKCSLWVHKIPLNETHKERVFCAKRGTIMKRNASRKYLISFRCYTRKNFFLPAILCPSPSLSIKFHENLYLPQPFVYTYIFFPSSRVPWPRLVFRR